MSAQDAPPPALDLSKPPNFDALLDWVKKLQIWCNEAVQRFSELDEELAHARLQAEDAETNAEGKVKEAEESFNDLVEFVKDVERGVRRGPELFAYMRAEGWM